MTRIATTVALFALLAAASTTQADITSWNYRDSYSTTDNSLGAGKFTSGYLSGAEGTFHAFDRYSNDSGYNGINRWDETATGTDGNGNAGINSNATATEMGDWGTGGMYFEAGATTLMPGTVGNWAAVRWTAPTDGDYRVKAVFTDQCIDASGDKPTAVYMREGKLEGSLFWTSTLSGFVGRAANGYSDATGTNQSATYEQVLYLTTGQAVDAVVAAGSSNYLTTGVDYTITAVPEPSSAIVAAGAILGLLAYAWRKRK